MPHPYSISFATLGVNYIIEHTRSKLCWHVNSKTELVLSRDCSTMFEYTNSQRIIHTSTGKCAFVSRTGNGARISLSTFCSDDNSEWIIKGGSLTNPSSDKCIHPAMHFPEEGEPLVLWSACGMDRIAFNFQLSKSKLGFQLVRHISL